MGQIKKAEPAKLIVGFIFRDPDILRRAVSLLERNFGKIDFESGIIPFEHTDYYEKEFGKGLKRIFVSFKKLILYENLPQIKILTNKIEHQLAKGACRLINIDPGYLDLAKLILASTKDFRHRIYLNKGIYGDPTLFFQNKTFQIWEWTFPDYRTDEYIAIFNQIREIYAKQIKNVPHIPGSAP